MEKRCVLIKIVKGDLFKLVPSPCIIVHGCNAQGKMNSGFAKLIRDKYPKAYQEYRDQHDLFGLPLGTNVISQQTDGTIIVNGITQQHYGRDGKRYVDYLAVETCLKLTAMLAASLKLPVYLPLIGGGLGGGDREYLLKLFEACFSFENVDATLVEYN